MAGGHDAVDACCVAVEPRRREAGAAGIVGVDGGGAAAGHGDALVVELHLLQTSLLDQAVDEDLVGLGQGAAHKLGHHDVAAHVAVLAQVQALLGHTEPQLDGLGWLAGKAAAEGPFLLDVQAERGVDVGLDADSEVVEAGVVLHLAADAWQVADAVCSGLETAGDGGTSATDR